MKTLTSFLLAILFVSVSAVAVNAQGQMTSKSKADIIATNGVVHVIDKVIFPPAK